MQGDGGYLFFLALAVATSSIVVLVLTRQQWVPVVSGLIAAVFGKKPARSGAPF